MVGGEQDQVAFLDVKFLGERGFFGGAEEFDDGRLPFAILDLDERQTLGAKTLGVFGHGFDLALGGAGEALGVEGLHHAAIGNGAAEHLEGAGVNSSVKSASSMAKRVSGLSMP